MIKLIEGLHLTATNKRHLSQMVQANMTRGQSGKLAYEIEPIPNEPKQWRYLIVKRERDDWKRLVIRKSKGVFEYDTKH